jgi:TfoX/Sxy family transcriptional regulator of competence genes
VEKAGLYLRLMPANEALLARVRELLENVPDVEEKTMFRGVTFMVNHKMCVSVSGDELMCRIGPDIYDKAVRQAGVRAVMMGNREYRGYVYVSPEVLQTKTQLIHWVSLCLACNRHAEASKKRKFWR